MLRSSLFASLVFASCAEDHSPSIPPPDCAEATFEPSCELVAVSEPLRIFEGASVTGTSASKFGCEFIAGAGVDDQAALAILGAGGDRLTLRAAFDLGPLERPPLSIAGGLSRWFACGDELAGGDASGELWSIAVPYGCGDVAAIHETVAYTPGPDTFVQLDTLFRHEDGTELAPALDLTLTFKATSEGFVAAVRSEFVFHHGSTLAVVAPGMAGPSWFPGTLGLGYVRDVLAWPFDDESFALVEPMAGRIHRFSPATSEVVDTVEVGGSPTALASTPFGLVFGSSAGMPVRVLRPDLSIVDLTLPDDATDVSATYHGGRLLVHYALGDHSEAVLYGCR